MALFKKKKCTVCGKSKHPKRFRRLEGRRWAFTAVCDQCAEKKRLTRETLDKTGKELGLHRLKKKCSQCLKIKSGKHFAVARDQHGSVRFNLPCFDCCAKNRDRDRKNNPIKYLIRSARQTAISKGVKFFLTEKDIHVPKLCPVYGIPIRLEAPAWNPNKATLDRVIPNKGYVKGNIRIISWAANRDKGNLTERQLAKILKYVRDHKKKVKRIS